MNSRLLRQVSIASAIGLVAAATAAATAVTAVAATPTQHHAATTTPIKHVIVIIGENHSFDNVFAAYQPPSGQHVQNLLSEGIITKNGGLGPNWRKAQQLTAVNTKAYTLTPKVTGVYKTLPQPNTTYVSPACSGQPIFSPDKRFPAALPNAPFQITNYVPYFDSHL